MRFALLEHATGAVATPQRAALPPGDSLPRHTLTHPSNTMASLISGTEIAATVTDELTVEVAALKESTGGKVPGARLASVDNLCVHDSPISLVADSGF